MKPDAAPTYRALELEGSSNLRDLGGWPVADGRRVRFGRLYRSAHLARLAPRGLQVLAELGIRSVCDLRGPQETGQDPAPRLAGVQHHALPIDANLSRQLRELAAQRREPTAADMQGFMEEGYALYPQTCAAALRRIFDLILEPGGAGTPLLLHCTAGKDRTGFCSAMVLLALGVAWDSVLQDYLATQEHWRRDFKAPHGLSESVCAPLFAVSEALLKRPFAVIDQHHGGLDAYFAEVLGLGFARRAELQALLLVPADEGERK